MSWGFTLSRQSRPPIPDTTLEVLEYFVNNPQAADSLEGIARWRLMQKAVAQRVEETDRAVDWLLTHDFLLQEAVAGSAAVFRLNRRRIAEARQLLAAQATSHLAKKRPRGESR